MFHCNGLKHKFNPTRKIYCTQHLSASLPMWPRSTDAFIYLLNCDGWSHCVNVPCAEHQLIYSFRANAVAAVNVIITSMRSILPIEKLVLLVPGSDICWLDGWLLSIISLWTEWKTSQCSQMNRTASPVSSIRSTRNRTRLTALWMDNVLLGGIINDLKRRDNRLMCMVRGYHGR